MYTSANILAAIVSYNPTTTLIQNVTSLKPQVGKIIILDNASEPRSRTIVERIESDGDAQVLYYNENLGIATRLNQALSIAHNYGFSLLLTMDQDTVLFGDCVEQMLRILNENPEVDSIGPNRSQEFETETPAGYTVANYIITSGNLVKVNKALNCNGYMEDLFIDLVDIDFSLALRASGSVVARANRARMHHKVGETATGKLLFWTYHYQTHSSRRYYYISRNKIIVFNKYRHVFPAYITRSEVLAFFASLWMAFCERHEPEKIREARRGVRDGRKYTRECQVP